MIKRQMPEDHDPTQCTICMFLAKPCANCGKLHASYPEAARCMRENLPAFNQYQKVLSK